MNAAAAGTSLRDCVNTRTPLPDLDALEAFAAALAPVIPRGQLLILSGPLGAGKTALVAALARAWGLDANVSSPTYTLVHEYPSPTGPLVHIDAYRLPDTVDVSQAVDLEELLARARVVVVEWGERLLASHPGAWHLHLARVDEARSATWLQGGPVPA